MLFDSEENTIKRIENLKSMLRMLAILGRQEDPFLSLGHEESTYTRYAKE